MTIYIALHAWMWHVAAGFVVGFVAGGITVLMKAFPPGGSF